VKTVPFGLQREKNARRGRPSRTERLGHIWVGLSKGSENEGSCPGRYGRLITSREEALCPGRNLKPPHNMINRWAGLEERHTMCRDRGPLRIVSQCKTPCKKKKGSPRRGTRRREDGRVTKIRIAEIKYYHSSSGDSGAKKPKNRI